MMRIESVTVEHDGVTLWQEGADSMTDYFPAIHGCTQREALRYLAEDGTVPGCSVRSTNPRPYGRETDDTRRARRFAARAGLPYEDRVHFPARPTEREALADAAMEPGAVVILAHADDWRIDNTRGPVFRGSCDACDLAEGSNRTIRRPWTDGTFEGCEPVPSLYDEIRKYRKARKASSKTAKVIPFRAAGSVTP